MTTSISLSHSLRRAICWSAAAACLLAFQGRASAGPADVTAVVNDNGTLEIKRAPGTSGNEGSFFVGIRLEGDLEHDISVFVSDGPDDVLLDTFSRTGVSAIDVDADQSFVRFALEFDGDISVDVRTGGFCELLYLGLTGDLTLSGSSGGIAVEYVGAYVDGDVTLIGGPGGDGIFPRGFYEGGAQGGVLIVGGNLHIDGGPGNEFIGLVNAFVSQETVIDLGQSSNDGGTDADSCELYRGEFCGSVMISGDEGDDAVFLGNAYFLGPTIGGDLLVDLGNGADRLSIRGLTLLPCSDDEPTPILFLDGGNGNSDELSVFGFTIFPDEYTGFETVTIP